MSKVSKQARRNKKNKKRKEQKGRWWIVTAIGQKKRTSGTPFLPYAQAASIVTLALSPVALGVLKQSQNCRQAKINIQHTYKSNISIHCEPQSKSATHFPSKLLWGKDKRMSIRSWSISDCEAQSKSAALNKLYFFVGQKCITKCLHVTNTLVPIHVWVDSKNKKIKMLTYHEHTRPIHVWLDWIQSVVFFL